MLRDKVFKIASNPEYDRYERGLAPMVCKFFDKKFIGSGVATLANKSMPNRLQLANELHKPIIKKFKRRRRVYSPFKNNIRGAGSDDMQVISKYNKGIRYLLCAIDLFSKYAWVVSLKDKKVITIFMYFKVF